MQVIKCFIFLISFCVSILGKKQKNILCLIILIQNAQPVQNNIRLVHILVYQNLEGLIATKTNQILAHNLKPM